MFTCTVNRAAVACIGGMYEKLGRMVGRSYEETVSLLIKSLKNAEVFICFFPACLFHILPEFCQYMYVKELEPTCIL